MDLKYAHDYIDFVLAKERGGFISPGEKDMVLDRAQWLFYNEQFKIYGKDQAAKDSLSIFSMPFQFVTQNGFYALPADQSVNPCYQHLLSVYIQYFDNAAQQIRYKPIKFLSEDEIAERLDSQILKPSITNPVGEELLWGQFQLYPKAAYAGNGYYLRKPVKPNCVIATGLDGRTQVYDPIASTQLEWNEASMNSILFKAIALCGVNLSNEQLVRYTEMKSQQS